MIYEQRIYKVTSATRKEFVQFWGKTVMPILVKYDAKVIGAWETVIGDRNDFICILAYQDMNQRMQCWEKLGKDEEYNKNRSSLPIQQLLVSILKPAQYSPLQ